MKKLFTIIAAATMFAACSSKSDLDTQKDVVLTDTTNMYKSNASTDISSGQTNPATVAPQPQQQQPQVTRTIIRERTVYVDRTSKARRQTVHEATPVDPVVNVPQPQTNNTGSGSNKGTSVDPGAGTASTGGIGTGTGTGTSEPDMTPAKKKGWSNAAKDAVIGGASGAVLGAIISRKKVTGAVIGGVVGAAGGYIFGRKKDNKSLINYVVN
jgi:hypothetical protein